MTIWFQVFLKLMKFSFCLEKIKYNKFLYYCTFSELVTWSAVVLTCITIATLLYAYLLQNPVIKLETILNSLTLMLAITEVFFGILCLIPCGKKQYYY